MVYLNTPDALLLQRVTERGHTFNPAFVKGAASRARNTAAQFITDRRWYLDGSLPVDTLAEQLKAHPFFVACADF